MSDDRPRVVRDGKVAIQHRTTNPTSVQVQLEGGGYRDYYFRPLHNVSMAWVKEEDVEKILAVKVQACNCSNGALAPKFSLASETNVNIHETGDPQRRVKDGSFV